MEQTRAQLLARQEAERKRSLKRILRDNQNLGQRLLSEEVAVAFDAGQDLLALSLGELREAVSFSVDGELYLRTDIDSNKLRSAELYHFSEHLQNGSRAFRVMESLLRIAQAQGAVAVTVLPPADSEPVPIDGRVTLQRFLAALFPAARTDASTDEFEASILALLEA